MKKGCIGVFDSGVGGLTIWRAISQLLPHEDIIYFADQAYLPYGDKTMSEIRQRALLITDWLLDQGSSLVVLACNSATVAAIDKLRTLYKIPFVGIEPAVKSAASVTQTREIAVLATTTTLRSRRQRTLIRSHGDGMTVHLLSDPTLVDLIEKGETDSSRVRAILKPMLSPDRIHNSDVLVLGCTHYIFLKTLIQSEYPNLRVIEPSLAVASQVLRLRGPQAIRIRIRGKHRFYTSGSSRLFSRAAERLLGIPLLPVETLNP